jgi:hypothetical protein
MFKYACHRQDLNYADIGAIDAGDPEAMEKAFRGGRRRLRAPARARPQQME